MHRCQLALQLPTEEMEKSGSLSAGYEKESQSWELILRLAGSVQTLRQAFPQASFQELSGGYVTALVPEDAIEALAAQDSVIYIEQPKRIVTGVAQGVRASCIWPLQQEMTPVGPLSGRGIFVAIIDSGIDYFHPDFRNADGSSRIAWLFADGKEYSKAQIASGAGSGGSHVGTFFSTGDRSVRAMVPMWQGLRQETAGHPGGETGEWHMKVP